MALCHLRVHTVFQKQKYWDFFDHSNKNPNFCMSGNKQIPSKNLHHFLEFAGSDLS